MEAVADVVGYAANDAGQGIDFLAENQRFFVDEHVAQDTAAGAGNRSHDDGSPKWEVFTRGAKGVDGLFDAGDGKQGQANGVEQKPGVVLPHQQFAEYDDPKQCNGRAD